MTNVKYSKIKVELVGKNGNIFNLTSICLNAMQKAGIDKEERKKFLDEIMDSESYNNALGIIMKWVNVE